MLYINTAMHKPTYNNNSFGQILPVIMTKTFTAMEQTANVSFICIHIFSINISVVPVSMHTRMIIMSYTWTLSCKGIEWWMAKPKYLWQNDFYKSKFDLFSS